MTIREGYPRRNTSLTGQSRGQKVWSDTKGNGLDDSTNVDKYLEGIGQRETMKYLKRKLLLPHQILHS